MTEPIPLNSIGDSPVSPKHYWIDQEGNSGNPENSGSVPPKDQVFEESPRAEPEFAGRVQYETPRFPFVHRFPATNRRPERCSPAAVRNGCGLHHETRYAVAPDDPEERIATCPAD